MTRPSPFKPRLDLFREVLVPPQVLEESPLTAAEEAAFPTPVLSLAEAVHNRRQEEERDGASNSVEVGGVQHAPEECAVVGRVVEDHPMVVVDRPFVERPYKKRKRVVIKELDGTRVDLRLLGEYAVQLQAGLDGLAEGEDALVCVEGPVIARRRPRPRRPDDGGEHPDTSEYEMLMGMKGTAVGERRPRILLLRKNQGADNSSLSIIPNSLPESTEAASSPPSRKNKGKGKNRVRMAMDEVESALEEVQMEVRGEEEKRTRQAVQAGNKENAIPHENLNACVSPDRQEIQQRNDGGVAEQTASLIRPGASPSKKTNSPEERQPRSSPKKQQQQQQPGMVGRYLQTPPQPQVLYTKLKDCTSTDKRTSYNVWAVINKVSRKPFVTRTGKFMARVYLIDQDYKSPNESFNDFEFSLLATCAEDIPSLAENSVIRIHHMHMQVYNGILNGRVFDARSVVVFQGGVGDPITPEFTCNPEKMLYGKPDEHKVQELRLWWQSRGACFDLGLTEHELRFSQVVGPQTFDIYCYLSKKVSIKDPEWGKDCGVLRVTDGTRCPLNMKSYIDGHQGAEEGINAGNDTQFLCREGLLDLDVFVYGAKNLEQVFGPMRCDSYVLIKGVRCLREDLQMGRIYCVMHRFVLEEGYDCSFVELPLDHKAAVATRERIGLVRETATQPDSVIEQLFADHDFSERLMSQQLLEERTDAAGGHDDSFDSLNCGGLPGLGTQRTSAVRNEDDDDDAVPATSDEEASAPGSSKRARKSVSTSDVSSNWNSQKLRDVSVKVRRLDLSELTRWAKATDDEASGKELAANQENKSETGEREIEFNIQPRNLRSNNRQKTENADKKAVKQRSVTAKGARSDPAKSQAKQDNNEAAASQTPMDVDDVVPVVKDYPGVSSDLCLVLEESWNTSSPSDVDQASSVSSKMEVEVDRSKKRSKLKLGNYGRKRKSPRTRANPQSSESSEEGEVFATCPSTNNESMDTFATCPEDQSPAEK